MFELRFFEIYRSSEYVNLLIEGLLLSTSLTITSGIIGFLLAFILAALRYWNVIILGFFSACYIDFIRNTPLIVQLFFVTFGLPLLLGYVWPFWCHALLALTINFSGYFAEILRSGFESTSKGQIEAANALNLNRYYIFRKIILPQTIIKMFPSLSSQFIFIFLTTGIISEVGVTELTHAGLYIDSRSFRSFEIFIVLSVLYVLLSLIFKSTLEFVFKKTLGKSL
jgi:polar amino acid transport system permease protein